MVNYDVLVLLQKVESSMIYEERRTLKIQMGCSNKLQTHEELIVHANSIQSNQLENEIGSSKKYFTFVWLDVHKELVICGPYLRFCLFAFQVHQISVSLGFDNFLMRLGIKSTVNGHFKPYSAVSLFPVSLFPAVWLIYNKWQGTPVCKYNYASLNVIFYLQFSIGKNYLSNIEMFRRYLRFFAILFITTETICFQRIFLI